MLEEDKKDKRIKELEEENKRLKEYLREFLRINPKEDVTYSEH